MLDTMILTVMRVTYTAMKVAHSTPYVLDSALVIPFNPLTVLKFKGYKLIKAVISEPGCRFEFSNFVN
jgi:hypothetical protein